MFRETQHFPSRPGLFFSIYQSEVAIELRCGCEDYQNLRLISSCFSYEQAWEIACTMAQSKQIPVKDWVRDSE